MNPRDTDTGFMIVAAVRYCLERHTYAPSLCVAWLQKHWDQIADNDKTCIVRDVSEHIARGSRADRYLQTWRDLIAWVGMALRSDAEYAALARKARSEIDSEWKRSPSISAAW